jgi:transcriptional regulator with XRE-family HTH domain
MASLGKHIRRARIDQGLSQGTVADKLKTAQATVSNWETDKSRPSEAQLKRLEKLLGLVRPGRPQSTDDGSLDGTRAFGRWLERARESAGLSISELAEASGVSVPAIYNIESGRSPNPRATTRAKLERALNLDTPQDVVEVAEEASAIEGLGPLTDFDPHDSDDRPKRPGVYVFYDVSDRPIYVGKGSDIAKRVKDHEEKFWFKYPIVSTAAYVEITDETLRHQVEQVMIKFLKTNAVINKQSVER